MEELELKNRIKQLEQQLKDKEIETEELKRKIDNACPRQAYSRKLAVDNITVDEITGDKCPQVLHTVFYNERDWRTIKVDVSLRNADNNLVTGEPILLRPGILYESKLIPTTHIVHKEKKNRKTPKVMDILTWSRDTMMEIDASGKATLKFRIEDISAHHEDQLFLITLTAIDIKGSIAPVEIGPIEVKTKHPNDRSSKKEKRKPQPDDDPQDSADSPTTERVRFNCDCPVCKQLQEGVCEITGFYHFSSEIDEYVFSPPTSPSHSTHAPFNTDCLHGGNSLAHPLTDPAALTHSLKYDDKPINAEIFSISEKAAEEFDELDIDSLLTSIC